MNLLKNNYFLFFATIIVTSIPIVMEIGLENILKYSTLLYNLYFMINNLLNLNLMKNDNEIINDENKLTRENKCRKILEKIYNKKFPSIRPNWLKNPKTNRNLELDCYNDELKIALEYNGLQHYEFPNSFHKTKEEFENQKERDKIKKKLCKERKINLISVPYYVDDLEFFIKEKLKKLKYQN